MDFALLIQHFNDILWIRMNSFLPSEGETKGMSPKLHAHQVSSGWSRLINLILWSTLHFCIRNYSFLVQSGCVLHLESGAWSKNTVRLQNSNCTFKKKIYSHWDKYHLLCSKFCICDLKGIWVANLQCQVSICFKQLAGEDDELAGVSSLICNLTWPAGRLLAATTSSSHEFSMESKQEDGSVTFLLLLHQSHWRSYMQSPRRWSLL